LHSGKTVAWIPSKSRRFWYSPEGQAVQLGLPLTDRLFDCRYNHLGAVADGLKRHLDIRLVFLVRQKGKGRCMMMKTTGMKLVVFVLFLLFVGLSLGTSANATDDADEQTEAAFQLEPITVIATKTPKAPLDSPASVSVISDDEIDAFNTDHPFAPLFRTEGIYPRHYNGLADYWSRPMMRGQKALVLVDGLNWYDYAQYYDTGAIPMKDVEKIEVVRGPFSALYGTLAQTGVINYVTKIPYGTAAEASFTFGEDNTQYYSARIADRPFNPSDDAQKLSWAEKNL
jgi:iron complex outermembrane recepter protein